MMVRPLMHAAITAGALASIACTVTTTETVPATAPRDTSPADGGAPPSTRADAGQEAPKPKGIGTWEDRGIAVVAGSVQTRASCKDVCLDKGGACVAELQSVQGSSTPVAGVAQYVFVKPGIPAAYLPYDLATCSTVVDATKSASNGTGSLTKYECSCDGLPIPTRATVRPAEGVRACSEICASWGKSCTNGRTWEDGTQGGAIGYYGNFTRVKAFNCATAPAGKLDTSSLDAYSCACE